MHINDEKLVLSSWPFNCGGSASLGLCEIQVMVSLVFSWWKCNYISVRLNEIYHLPSKQKLFSSSEGALEHFNYLSMVGQRAIKTNSKPTVLKGHSASTCQKHLPQGASLVFQFRNRIQTHYVLKYISLTARKCFKQCGDVPSDNSFLLLFEYPISVSNVPVVARKATRTITALSGPVCSPMALDSLGLCSSGSEFYIIYRVLEGKCWTCVGLARVKTTKVLEYQANQANFKAQQTGIM